MKHKNYDQLYLLARLECQRWLSAMQSTILNEDAKHIDLNFLKAQILWGLILQYRGDKSFRKKFDLLNSEWREAIQGGAFDPIRPRGQDHVDSDAKELDEDIQRAINDLLNPGGAGEIT